MANGDVQFTPISEEDAARLRAQQMNSPGLAQGFAALGIAAPESSAPTPAVMRGPGYSTGPDMAADRESLRADLSADRMASGRLIPVSAAGGGAPMAAAQPADQGVTEALMREHIMSGARGSPGAYVAPSVQQLGSTVQRQAPIDPAIAEGMADARINRGLAVTQAESAQREAIAQGIADSQSRSEQLERQVAEREAARTDAQIETDKRFQRADDLLKQARETRVLTPEDVWDNKTAGQKFSAGIAAFLGGLMQGYYGQTSNSGLETVLRGMREEADAQNARRKELFGDAQVQLTLADQYAAQFGSPDAQLRARELALQEAAAEEIRRQALRSQDAEVQARAQEALAALEKEAADTRMAIAQAESGTIQEQFRNDPGGYRGGRAGGLRGMIAAGKELGLDPEAAVRMATGERASAPIAPEDVRELRRSRVVTPDGRQWAAPTPEAARETQTKVTNFGGLLADMQEVVRLSDQPASSLSPEAAGRLRALRASMPARWSEALGQGAMTDAEREVYDPLTAKGALDMTSGLTGGVRGEIEQAQSILARRLDELQAPLQPMPREAWVETYGGSRSREVAPVR